MVLNLLHPLNFHIIIGVVFYLYEISSDIEEYIGLDDNKYIGDLLADFKASKDRSKGEILHCKLTFKKKLFRESDEAVTDPMFVQLSYVQVSNFIQCSSSHIFICFKLESISYTLITTVLFHCYCYNMIIY